MNEGDSAGGGQQGQKPAPPAVPDRRSTFIVTAQMSKSGSAVPISQMSRFPDRSQQQPSQLNSNQSSTQLFEQYTNLHQSSPAPGNSFYSNSGNNLINCTTNSSSDSNNSAVGVQTNTVTNTSELLRTHSAVLNSSKSVVGNNENLSIVKQTGEPANKKRCLRFDESINYQKDSLQLKKLILEHKLAVVKELREKHYDYVVQLFISQTSGNIMEYPLWRKKPQTPQFINFMNSYRLDAIPSTIVGTSVTVSTTTQSTQNQNTVTTPIGAEIKIPGVGVTPVAVSTTLPAAVVQLTQQGHVPGRPQGGRHGMVFGQIPVSPAIGQSFLPLVPGGTPIVPDLPGSSNFSERKKQSLPNPSSLQSPSTSTVALPQEQQFSVKARQEVYVMQRISELQRDGMWTERRLPKVQEPQRPKAHWDYLLEEMVWLAADFAQERKWKKAAAKKCARMVQKHFQDRASAAQKAEKAQELQLKRIAGFIAKEIKIFWSNVEKLVEYKQQTKLEEKRKKALDQHLSFIVDQTEKFSQQLAEGMNKSAIEPCNSAAPSHNSSRISSPKPARHLSDDEFSPGNASSDDDEETIAKAEAEEVTNVKEEVEALRKESEMELDAFLKVLPKDYLENRDKIVLETETPEQTDESFHGSNISDNDVEDTIMEQEKSERKCDYKAEIEELEADNNMSIEEIMAQYKGKEKSMANKMELDSDDDSDSGDEESEEENESEEAMSEDESELNFFTESVGLKDLLQEDEGKDSQVDKDDLINDAAALAESIQPKGNTLSSTNVVTPVPFLLQHTLREYQHIGLDWLVTMHDRKLNGILADEMGLGKTIQTIALLAHLACVKANWGPHLIVVPSSVMLNWEMEFKKWCPGFKILTYYGTQKERKQKRIGWTKINAFHICITSYKLVIQDHQSFRRKKWKYLILDEAQNIKNFKSQRWQLLLNFQTEQRLLLTGTPLQNNLMELWSLMHFLMPHVFQSHREFKEWFSNPMTGMIEGNSEYNDSIIKRLHKVLRPFLLRRLKSEVEKQMPKKYEHVVMCRLSKRQRYLYDDFMSRAKTKETLESGNLLSVINVLMQLRKVCNHPNMFEVRPTISPFRMEGIDIRAPSIVCNMLDYDPFNHIDLSAMNMVLVQLESCLSAYVAHSTKRLQAPKKLIEEIDSVGEPPIRCPNGKFKMHIRIRDSRIQEQISGSSGVKVGTSPAMKTEGTKFVPVSNSLVEKNYLRDNQLTTSQSIIPNTTHLAASSSSSINTTSQLSNMSLRKRIDNNRANVTQMPQLLQSSTGRHFILTPTSSGTTTLLTTSGQRLTVVKSTIPQRNGTPVSKPVIKFVSNQSLLSSSNTKPLAAALAHQLKNHSLSSTSTHNVTSATNVTVDKEFLLADREQTRKQRRTQHLQFIAKLNQRKCDAAPLYGSDLRESIEQLYVNPVKNEANTSWLTRSYSTCRHLCNNRENWSLVKAIKTIVERTDEMKSTFSNFVLFVPAVSARQPYLNVSHLNPSKRMENSVREKIVQVEMSPKLTLLHPIISAMSTQFPDPRLIQYDCGKLQTLDRLLRQLKSGSHRVLIFTQMTRMLDVLEAFLNFHGHIYLRLDGSTRIEQRQILMDRFNNDKRIFVFILSTRSGGVGVNLTGADTVIFYDSDWNPTMDAQAQDRCHRIGQTRDVHIYRLVSEKTIEENILKKANQKRLLGDLAIEGGNFTTAYFKSTTIQDLFAVDSNDDDVTSRLSDVLDRDRDRRQRLQENLAITPSQMDDKSTVGVFETALAAAEDEQDVQAAKIASAEAAADLAEFDESIPIEDNDNKLPEMSKAEQEVQNLVKQLSPIERYAMRFVEETGGSWTAEQLRAAEAEIEQQKREWEANRLAALKKEEEDARRAEEEENELLTYSREDAKNQIWISNNTGEKMPMWCPPTPPQDDNDLYVDYSLTFLYETDIIPESHLPPVYVKKEREFKRNRSEAGFLFENRRPVKIRKEDNYYAPRSLFDKPTPAMAKLRRDLKLQRYRGIFKPPPVSPLPGTVKPVPTKPIVEPEGMAEFLIYEDMSILDVIQQMQGLPLNLMLLSPGHTPNWDLVADIVNQHSRVYRTPKHCRYRYEAAIVPREEGKLIESPKKQKKTKNPLKASPPKGLRALRSAQIFTNDNNNAFSKLMKTKFDHIRTAYLKKAPQLRQVLINPTLKNPKHAAVFAEYGVANYESPISALDIAARRAEKLNQKKHQVVDAVQQQTPPPPHQSVVNQQIQGQLSSPATAIAVQSAIPGVSQVVQAVSSIVQANQLTVNRPSTITLTQTPSQQTLQPQQQTQLVKAIVQQSQPIQHVTITQNQQQPQQQFQHVQTVQVAQAQSQSQQLQNQQQQSSPVSVVLTTPVSAMSSLPPNIQTQMVSLHQTIVPVSSTIISQSSGMSMVQTISTQSNPQVVSVAQLTGAVGTVFTTSSLPTNAAVATLTTSALRAQRIVAAPGTLQEVVLSRSGSQSPTVVSVSGLGQNVTQGQLQTQLRLSMGAGQQVVAKSIPVGAITTTGKPVTQSPQIQFYRQQPIRQQLKVLHPGTSGTLVQTAGGQLTTQSGTIIQGGIVQGTTVGGQTVQIQTQSPATTQKVSVAAVSVGAATSAIVTNVATMATVQMNAGQARTQFVKQMGTTKQTITRPATESEMLLLRRQIMAQQQQQTQQKTQVIPQQIFTPTNIQVQQPGPSTQQITTLVKTSSGSVVASGPPVSATGTVNMTLSQIKSGQIRTTIPNTGQVKQIQLQQQLTMATQQQTQQQQQQRKGTKMAQITQVGAKPGIPTQLIVQSPKTIPGGVSVQQIQQVIRHAQPAGQIVLGKAAVSRVIPVSVSSQPNARQTIQVVSAAQSIAAGSIRTHVAGPTIGTAHTIKMAPGTTPQQQQAIFNALQAQQVQRSAASPVRLQTTSGSLLAVVQQPTSTANIVVSGQNTAVIDIPTTTMVSHQMQQIQQQQQQSQQQQPQQAIQQQQPPKA